MSKNKPRHLLGWGAIALAGWLISTGAAAQPGIKTVDDLLRSGKLTPSAPAISQIMPPEVSNKPVAPMDPMAIPPVGSAPSAVNPNPVLTGIYQSKDTQRAEIDIAGTRRTYAVGDLVQGGWNVSAIKDQQVVLKRCAQKKCSTQTLSLGD